MPPEEALKSYWSLVSCGETGDVDGAGGDVDGVGGAELREPPSDTSFFLELTMCVWVYVCMYARVFVYLCVSVRLC